MRFRRWLITHPRLSLGTAGVVALSIVAVSLSSLTARNLARMRIIENRAEQLSSFEQLRVSLQRRLFEDLGPALPWNHFLVQELRIQVGQALALGDRLDPGTRDRLEGLDARLSGGPFVSRETLLDAVDLLGRMIEAESDAQSALIRGIESDAARESRWMIGGLLALTILMALGAWLVPRALVRPLQDVVRSASQALLEQHRSLARAERLAAVGETAAGVAHELHNPLAAVTLGLENIVREREDPTLTTRLEPLVGELERMGRILKSYLSSARASPEEATQVDLHQIVSEIFDLLRYQLPSAIALENAVKGGTACVLPKDRTRQVILNLVLNSAQVIGDGDGSITVAAASEGPYIMLTVDDTGPGFPTRLLEEGVRPFASSREGGTGLGLVLVQRTMKELGGVLELSNPEGGGARVTIRIPCHSQSQESRP
jgi:signal transduction histidine kinase